MRALLPRLSAYERRGVPRGKRGLRGRAGERRRTIAYSTFAALKAARRGNAVVSGGLPLYLSPVAATPLSSAAARFSPTLLPLPGSDLRHLCALCCTLFSEAVLNGRERRAAGAVATALAWRFCAEQRMLHAASGVGLSLPEQTSPVLRAAN
jgi:hypothetical protein